MIEKNQQTILELLKASLFHVAPAFPDDADWEAVLQEATAQTVVGLTAPAVPAAEAEKWRIPAARNTAGFLRILHAQAALVTLFDAADIPLVILKGTAAAMYYPSPQRRTMGDVDFIVPPERFDDAARLMQESGYRFNGDYGDGRDYSYQKDGVEIELHRRYSDEGRDIDPLLFGDASQIVRREVLGVKFPCLDDRLNGLLILDHVRHHLYGGIGLRQIIDWMMFVHAYLTDEVWEREFQPLAAEAGLDILAMTMTKMCRVWLGLPDEITWCDPADDLTAGQLMETVLRFGNFGRKDPYVYRPMEGVAMGVRKDGLFRFLQNTGMENWKAAKKHRILRPFAWIYQVFRFAGRGLAALFSGKHLVQDASSGVEKADFYRRLGIER